MKNKYLKRIYISLFVVIGCLFCVLKNINAENEAEFIKEPEVQTVEITPNELFLGAYNIIKSNYWDKALTDEILPRWKKRYEGKIQDDEDAKVAINSMLQSLDDPYSKFLDTKEVEELTVSINSKIYGIGINVASVSGKIVIVNVIKDTPADLAGLKNGDLITKINGEDVQGENIFQISSLIKNPKIKIVDMEILRGDEKLKKQVKKAEIKVKTVKADILDKEIGYIRISSFISNNTPIEFIDAMNKVKDTNALILDLRGNTGGLFQNAIFVADLFLNDKDIVSVLGRGGHKSTYRAHNGGYTYTKPMAVLVDMESASASEIVSGALKDNGRAVIIGTKTFGKGLVQKVFPMPGNTGMNLTIARYLTPLDTDINKKGIMPDYVVQITDNDIVTNNDRQLNFALQRLKAEIERSKIAGR